jgi:hypothetical protein
VEPGNILKRIGGTKMEEQNIEDLGLEPVETWSLDKDGNLVKIMMY